MESNIVTFRGMNEENSRINGSDSDPEVEDGELQEILEVNYRMAGMEDDREREETSAKVNTV